jgi:HEPN domain-containing protein
MDDRLHILRWFEFASDDLDSAKILVKYGLRKANAVGYHSQQSAEKNLKGYLLASGLEEPPHIHNLPALAALCEDYGVSFSEIIAPCSRLNPYGVRVKYPDEIDIDERNAAQAISDAETVASFAPIAEMRKALETEHRKEYDIAEIARIAGVTDESGE